MGVALILEGGGMRGVYTAGVLDYFMEKKLDFKIIYGVSAGALNGANYKSRQIGRSVTIFTRYTPDNMYSGPKYLLTEGSWFNNDFAYGTIPDLLVKADYETFKNNPATLYAVVSNIDTGRAEYMPVTDVKEQMDVLRASASLPGLSDPVEIDGQLYLDGGICDSIPLRRSINSGNEKNVVILTRHRGYVKSQGSNGVMAKLLYGKYPNFANALTTRHIVYNYQTKYASRMEEERKAFVIRPREPVEIRRLEKDPKKLWDLYEKGFEDGKSNYDRVLEYISQ